MLCNVLLSSPSTDSNGIYIQTSVIYVSEIRWPSNGGAFLNRGSCRCASARNWRASAGSWFVRLALGFGVFQSILMLFLYLILDCLKNELTHFGSLWHTFSSLDPIVYSCLLGPPRGCERAAGCQSWYADAILLHVLYLKATSDGPLTAKRYIGWAWSRPW